MKTNKNSQTSDQGLPSQSEIEQASHDTNQNGQDIPQSENVEAFGPVIFSYTRKQALADGVQVNVTDTAKECGFKIPVFLTHSVYDAYVRVPEGVECQDEAGRLWDILWMLYNTIRSVQTKTERLPFQLFVRNDNRKAKLVTLHAVSEQMDFDDPAPVITVSLPYED